MSGVTNIGRAALLLLAAAPAVWALGCGSSTTQPSREAPSGQIVLSSEYSGVSSGSLQRLRPAAQGPATPGVDSIAVTRVRLALRDIKFKTHSDSADFRTPLLVLEMNLRGTLQNVSAADVPFGTYHRIEFDVHKILTAVVALLPPGEQAQFEDFLVGGGKSVIVDGRVYKAGGAHDFTFYSALNVNQKTELSPALEVSEASPVANVTMKVTAGDWFSDSKGGLLDPSDPSEDNAISHNISRSIHVFKDTNRDGNPD